MHGVNNTIGTQTQQHRLGTREIICAIFFFFYCLPAFSPAPSFSPFLAFCLTPAVTRSNLQSNDRRSLTLIKGGQLTGGPGVTFIRRLVKVYLRLALNTEGGMAGQTGRVPVT